MVKRGDPEEELARRRQEQVFTRELEERRLATQLEVARLNAKHQAPRQMWQNIMTAPWDAVVYIFLIIHVSRMVRADKPVPDALLKLLEKY